MTGTDDLDDLSAWADDPLVRALRAPGTPAELAGEHEFVAAFGQQRPRSSARRLAGRFGIGATSAVVTVALTAGVAAAYGRVLPAPVQDFAHGVLGPVGVPAPARERPATPSAPEATAPVTEAPPSVTETPKPPASPTPTPSAPTEVPSPAATATAPVGLPPAPESTPTQAPPVVQRAAAVRVSTPSRHAVVGSTVTVAGVVTDADGKPLGNKKVRLIGRTAGQPWTRWSAARTSDDGHVTLTSPPLTSTAALRLSTGHRAHRVRSTLVTVVVRPVLEVTVAAGPTPATTTLTVTARGGQPGDAVVGYRIRGRDLAPIGSAHLDQTGSAVLSITTPQRPVRVLVRLAGSPAHGRSLAFVRVPGSTT